MKNNRVLSILFSGILLSCSTVAFSFTSDNKAHDKDSATDEALYDIKEGYNCPGFKNTVSGTWTGDPDETRIEWSDGILKEIDYEKTDVGKAILAGISIIPSLGTSHVDYAYRSHLSATVYYSTNCKIPVARFDFESHGNQKCAFRKDCRSTEDSIGNWKVDLDKTCGESIDVYGEPKSNDSYIYTEAKNGKTKTVYRFTKSSDKCIVNKGLSELD